MRAAARILAIMALPVLPHPARAEALRLATWDIGFHRDGPGLMLRDIEAGKDRQVAAAVAVLVRLHPDIVLLTGIDWDHEGRALDALRARLKSAGLDYGWSYAPRPNTGRASGIDLDGDGRTGGPGDAQGYGTFSGAKGMALLSRLPIEASRARDYSAFLWADLPDGLIAGAGLSEAARKVQRLSSTGHWVVPVRLGSGEVLSILAFAATPPVFDGPEDRNGRRNHDETAFWLDLLDGRIPGAAPVTQPFAIMGEATLDAEDSEGRPEALQRLLADPRLSDPLPASPGGAEAADATHRGDPGLDTADYGDPPGNLRVDYVLPSSDLAVTGAGVVWPLSGDDLAADVRAASRHRLVWVDIVAP